MLSRSLLILACWMSVTVRLTAVEVPTPLPTVGPTRQPTCQPSGQPTRIPTGQPTRQPSRQPTGQPTRIPTGQPTITPTIIPTGQPTKPTGSPTGQPSRQPSRQPTGQPTRIPTGQPTQQPSRQPTRQPSRRPSRQPTGQPTRIPTGQPTQQPSRQPTGQPSRQPTGQPSRQPSRRPSGQPTGQPSRRPTGQPSRRPSGQPSRQPTGQPSRRPSGQPTGQPSRQPTGQPSRQPTGQPSRQPTGQPSLQPSSQPSRQPTCAPTSPSGQPTRQPTRQPTSLPTRQPTGQPTRQPLARPSSQPTRTPTGQPTVQPTSKPSSQPVARPSSQPTRQPSRQPSSRPSRHPTSRPSGRPSRQPTGQPSRQPSVQPSNRPTAQPTNPTGQPSRQPTAQPTMLPTTQPTGEPTLPPSSQPSSKPTLQPFGLPTGQPTVQPTNPTGQPSAMPTNPTGEPTRQPTGQPTRIPSGQPSVVPSMAPSSQPSGQPSCSPTGQPTLVPTAALESQVSFDLQIMLTNYHGSQRDLSRKLSVFQAATLGMNSLWVFETAIQKAIQYSEGENTDIAKIVFGSFKFIITEPTSRPTGQPSSEPSRKPSGQPSGRPTIGPTMPSARLSRELLHMPAYGEDVTFSFKVQLLAEKYIARGSAVPAGVTTLAYNKAVARIASDLKTGIFLSNAVNRSLAINDTALASDLSTLVVQRNCSDHFVCASCQFGMCIDNKFVVSILHSAKPTGTPTSMPSQIHCPAGYFHRSDRPECGKCSAGYYSSADAYACSSCSAGTSSPEASKSCSDCQVGRFAPIAGSFECHACTWPYTTITTKSTVCSASCYCLDSQNLSLATSSLVVIYILLMLHSGFTLANDHFDLGDEDDADDDPTATDPSHTAVTKKKKMHGLTVEDRLGYSFRMVAFTALPLLDFLTDFIYILSSSYASPALLAFSIIFTLMPTVYFLRKLYDMGALWPRLIIPLPFFVTNMRYMWWLRFEKGFPRYVNGWDPPKAVLELKLAQAKEKKKKPKHIAALEARIALYGPKGELPWHKFAASFDKHDSLPKLFMYWLLWGLVLCVQAFYIAAWCFVAGPILMFNSPVLLSWAAIGAFLYQSKCLAIGSTWNVWIRIWHGHSKKKPCPFLTEEGKAPYFDPAIDTALMNESFYAGFIFEAIPQLIIQLANNSMTGAWTPFAFLSLSTSCYMVCIGSWRYLSFTRTAFNVNGTQVYTVTKTDLRKVPLSYSVPALRPETQHDGKGLSYWISFEFYWITFEVDHGTFSDRFMREFAAQKPWVEVLREQWEDVKKRMLPEHKEDPGVRVKLTRKKDGKNIAFELMNFDRRKLGLPTRTKKDEVIISIDDLVPYVKEKDDSSWVQKKPFWDPERSSSDDESRGTDDGHSDESSVEEKQETAPPIDPVKVLHTVLDAEFEFHHSDEDSLDEYSDIDPVARELYLINSDDEFDDPEDISQLKSASRDGGGWGGFGGSFWGLGTRSVDAASRGRRGSVDSVESLDESLTRSHFNKTSFRTSQQLRGSFDGGDGGGGGGGGNSIGLKRLAPIPEVVDFWAHTDFDAELESMKNDLSKMRKEMTKSKAELRHEAPELFPKSAGQLSQSEFKALEQIRDPHEHRREMTRFIKQRIYEKKFNTIELAQEQPFAVKVPDILKKETRLKLVGVTVAGESRVEMFKSHEKSKSYQEYCERLKSVHVGSLVRGVGIAPGTAVAGKDATAITLSEPAIESLAKVKLDIIHQENLDALSPTKKNPESKKRSDYKKYWNETKLFAKTALKSAKSLLPSSAEPKANDGDAEDPVIKPANLNKLFDSAAKESTLWGIKKVSTKVMILSEEDGEMHEEGTFFREHDPEEP